MKKLLLLIAVLVANSAMAQQNGLEAVIVEKYYVSNAADASASVGALPVGSTTYRIYLDLLPGYTFQAAYGVANQELRFQTTTSFFNNEDFGSTSPNYSKSNARFNTVMLDSWVTAGAACTGNYGILKAEDNATGGTTVINADGVLANADPGAGIPLTSQDGLYQVTGNNPPSTTLLGFTPAQLAIFDNTSQFGNLISTFNASWAALGGVSGPTAGNKVLIGQFTTDGVFSFKLNVQLGTPIPGISQNFVAANPTGLDVLFPALNYTSPSALAAGVSISCNRTFPVCSGTSLTFTATPTNGGSNPSYQWKRNGTNVGTNSPTYTSSALTNGQVITCVMTSNLSGVSNNPATSNAITALVNSAPAVPTITATGPTSYCSGANACTLSTAIVSGLSYQWLKGAAAVSGATSTSYVPNATTSNTYKVRVTTAAGCSKTSSATSITVLPLPTATVSSTGPTTFCSGANACTLTANAGTGLSYQWFKGTAAIAGATNISFVPTSTSSQYKVRVTGSNGCSKTSSNTAISVIALPSATITPQGPTTFCNGDSVVLLANAGTGFSYQWRQGTTNLIPGATSQSYTAKSAATYFVIVTNSSGCSKTSSGRSVVVNCREGLNGTVQSGFTIYPNPGSGRFTMNYTDADASLNDANLYITDVSGRIIYSERLTIENGSMIKDIDLTNVVSSGIYFVQVDNGKEQVVSKLVVE
jgi:hypothetical protein